MAFNGAISPQTLAQETGTALTALARLVGPAVNWLGAIFVILSLGMACIHISLGLLFLVEERLPMQAAGWLGGRGRFLLSISPVVAVFLVAEWLSITGQGSFAGLLGFVGVIALPLLGGIFPVLLLAATRRKGDLVPSLVLRFLGHPVVLVGIYLLFLGSIFTYGLLIYQDPVERLVTLLVGSLVLIVTIIMLRRGALNTRVVVELRGDYSPGGQHLFHVTANGQPAGAQVCLNFGQREQRLQAATGDIPDFASLRAATFQLPTTGASELKVWAHQITPEWASEALPARLTVNCGHEKQELDLGLGGQVLLPLRGEPCQVAIAIGKGENSHG